ncbi:MAG: hypothetical protein ACJAZK_002592 [Psychroserpens sp.]|jgi:hypothetical protein|uniref:DUF3667 domain-containing protein n=1 Tax=Psychroserpens sp. TaxID=2020870 RepID=UPI0039E32E45
MECKNCKNQLPKNSDFCNECGGKVIRNRLTFRNIFEHISETFFNYDNKLLRTLVDLFKKPETVIGGYIDGVRKRYVNPISYFGLAITMSGLYLIIVSKFYPESMDFSILTAPGQEEFQQKNMSFVQEYQSLFMMFYIPIYALIARITFLGLKKFNYTELLVIFMFTQAQISILSAFSTIILAMCGITHGVISLVMLPLMIIYNAFVLKRLYELNIGSMIARLLLFFVILGVCLFIGGIIAAIIMFINGDFQEIMEAQKAAKEVAVVIIN